MIMIKYYIALKLINLVYIKQYDLKFKKNIEPKKKADTKDAYHMITFI